MPHFVYKTTSGKFISTRKNNGSLYMSRVTLSDDLEGARIFNTAGAATNAGNSANETGKALKVTIKL